MIPGGPIQHFSPSGDTTEILLRFFPGFRNSILKMHKIWSVRRLPFRQIDGRFPRRREFSSAAAAEAEAVTNDKIVASVLFERPPVVVPKIDPIVFAFQEFSFRWNQRYRREYPEKFLQKSDEVGKGDYQIEYEPAPRITEADNVKDQKSLKRALDQRLYLLLYGNTIGSPDEQPVWHFPEKVYESEETLRKCAESALESVIGDLTHTYFVGNAPMAHMVIQPSGESSQDSKSKSFKRFFFKCQVNAANKYNVGKCKDFVWATKDELLEYFPEQSEFLSKMIINYD